MNKVLTALLLMTNLANTNNAIRLCSAEIAKDKPNISIVKKECFIAAKEQEKKKIYGDVSWYYLLSSHNNKNIYEIENKIDNGNYSNIAHSYVLMNNFKKAEKNYIKYLTSIYTTFTAFKVIPNDYKILFKLYPNKKELLTRGLALWERIYKPLALYPLYRTVKDHPPHKKAIEYLTQIIELQKKSGFKNDILVILLYNELVTRYVRHGEYDKSLETIKSIKHLYGDNKKYEIDYIKLIDILAIYDKENAIQHYKTAIQMKEKLLGTKDPSTADSYYYLAGLHQRMRNIPEAIKYYKKALKIRKEILPKDSFDINIIYSILARLYMGNPNITLPAYYNIDFNTPLYQLKFLYPFP